MTQKTITKSQLKEMIKEALVEEQKVKMTEQELFAMQRELLKQIKSSLLAFKKNQRYNAKLQSEKVNSLAYANDSSVRDILDSIMLEADDVRDKIDAKGGNYGGF